MQGVYQRKGNSRLCLTHCYVETCKSVIGNIADPDQTPDDVASDQGLNCLLTEFFISNRSDTPKMTNGIIQHIYIYIYIYIRAREIVGFAGSGPIFETEDRFISRQEAKKSVHKTVFLKILQYTD